MFVIFRESADREELIERIRVERNVLQRDRLRAALLAAEGNEAPAVARMLGRSRRFAQTWAYAYRDGGIDAIKAAKPTGRPTTLPREKEPAFKARMLGGPTDADGGVCTLRGRDAMQILKAEFGAQYTLDGVYDLLDRLGLSCLSPRPTHRKNDPEAMRAWAQRAPFLSRP